MSLADVFENKELQKLNLVIVFLTNAFCCHNDFKFDWIEYVLRHLGGMHLQIRPQMIFFSTYGRLEGWSMRNEVYFAILVW